MFGRFILHCGCRPTLVLQVEQAERDLEHVRSELRRAVTARKRHEERNYNARTRAALLGTGDSGGTYVVGRSLSLFSGRMVAYTIILLAVS